jgi:hypothetical protein
MNYIVARFKGKCSETGKTIPKGENCLHDPFLKQVYAMDSPKGIKWQQDEQNSHLEAGKMAQAEQEAFYDNFCQRNSI